MADGSTKHGRKKSKKPKHVELLNLAGLIGDEPNALDEDTGMPQLSRRFFYIKPDYTSASTIYVEHVRKDLDDIGVYQVVSRKDIEHALIRHCCSRLSYNAREEYDITESKAKEAVTFWQANYDGIQRPKHVVFKTDPSATFRRLPFDLPKKASLDDCPHFRSTLQRMTHNVDAFCAWVGSLLIEQSDISQYVWLHGDGNDGKSTLIQWVKEIFGKAASPEQPSDLDGKHWTAGLIGRRVIYFPDLRKPDIVTHGKFMTITGGDDSKIEPKYEAPFSYYLGIKFMVGSNKYPIISSKRCDTRRAIFCHMRTIENQKIDPKFLDRLIEETPFILKFCMDLYYKMVTGHGTIPVDPTALADAIDESEDVFHEIYYKEFESPDGFQNCVSGEQMKHILRRHRIADPQKQREFTDWLSREHRVERKRSGKGMRYIGMRVKKMTHVGGAAVEQATTQWESRT